MSKFIVSNISIINNNLLENVIDNLISNILVDSEDESFINIKVKRKYKIGKYFLDEETLTKKY